jgi:hypothetical protein
VKNVCDKVTLKHVIFTAYHFVYYSTEAKGKEICGSFFLLLDWYMSDT